MEETFVILSSFDKKINPLLLNLLEMWCCLVLQTLTMNGLLAFLPAEVLRPDAGRHLNVALPIHQSTRDESYEATKDLNHGDIYHATDPLLQEYYASLRWKFFELKNSPNHIHREYYWNRMRERQPKAAVTKREKVLKSLERKEKKITVSPRGEQSFSIYEISINISQNWVILDHGTSVFVKYDLGKEGECNPNRYARKSVAGDPAARLGIFVDGTDREGRPFQGWVHSDGKGKVIRVRKLVDYFEGRELYGCLSVS